MPAQNAISARDHVPAFGETWRALNAAISQHHSPRQDAKPWVIWATTGATFAPQMTPCKSNNRASSARNSRSAA